MVEHFWEVCSTTQCQILFTSGGCTFNSWWCKKLSFTFTPCSHVPSWREDMLLVAFFSCNVCELEFKLRSWFQFTFEHVLELFEAGSCGIQSCGFVARFRVVRERIDCCFYITFFLGFFWRLNTWHQWFKRANLKLGRWLIAATPRIRTQRQMWSISNIVNTVG